MVQKTTVTNWKMRVLELGCLTALILLGLVMAYLISGGK